MTADNNVREPAGSGEGSSQWAFGRNILELMRRRGWSNADVAGKMTVSTTVQAAKQALYNAQQGKQSGLPLVDDLAAIFGVTPAEMLTPLPCAVCGNEPAEGMHCMACDRETPLPANLMSVAAGDMPA